MFSMRFKILFISTLLFTSCIAHKKESSVGDFELATAMQQQPLSPEESKAMLKDIGKNWLYGQGIGHTTLQVGGIILYPPYAFFVLGNGILNIAGYESLGIGTLLPEKPREKWYEFYDTATSGPGRFAAAIAGNEFVTTKRAAATLKSYIKQKPVKTKAYQPVSTSVEY